MCFVLYIYCRVTMRQTDCRWEPAVQLTLPHFVLKSLMTFSLKVLTLLTTTADKMEAGNDHMLQDNDRTTTTTTEALLKTCLTCSHIKNIKKQKQLMLKWFYNHVFTFTWKLSTFSIYIQYMYLYLIFLPPSATLFKIFFKLKVLMTAHFIKCNSLKTLLNYHSATFPPNQPSYHNIQPEDVLVTHKLTCKVKSRVWRAKSEERSEEETTE